MNLGLILSGGGIRGVAHIGLLRLWKSMVFIQHILLERVLELL